MPPLLLASAPSGGGGGGFTIPTPPTPTAGSSATYNPNLLTGPTGKDRTRPWIGTVIDGVQCWANGHDQPWYYSPTDNAFYDLGSVVPTGNSAAVSGASGWLANGDTATYYVVGYNSTLGKETAPQTVTVTNSSGGTRDVTLTLSDPGGEFDKNRIYRRLGSSDNFKLVVEQAAATSSYVDSSADSAILNNTAYIARYRETKPPIFEGIVEYAERLWGWVESDPVAYYGQITRTDGVWVQDDFPSGNILPIGMNDTLGGVVVAYPLDSALYFFKRRGCYELTGEDASTFVLTRRFADRGCIAPRTLLEVEGLLVFLDERGLALWAPGADQPVIAGASEGSRESPLAPLWKRLNLDARKKFWAQHNEEDGTYELWVALDHDPVATTRIVYDYRRNVFVAVDYGLCGAAGGLLDDAGGTQHVIRLDDLGYAWEEYVGNAEGVYAGDTTADITSAAGTLLTCSGASFDTTDVTDAGGCPIDRYDSDGDVVDENRVYLVTSTSLETLYWSSAAADDTQTVAVGVIPAVFQTGGINFGSSSRKYVPRIYVEFEEQASGSLRFDTSRDGDAFTLADEMDMTVEGAEVVPIQDRFNRWRLRASQRYAGLGFRVTLLEMHVRTLGTES